jgi:hypothetical protein
MTSLLACAESVLEKFPGILHIVFAEMGSLFKHFGDETRHYTTGYSTDRSSAQLLVMVRFVKALKKVGRSNSFCFFR